MTITTNTSVTNSAVLSVAASGKFISGETITVDMGGSITGGNVAAAAFQLNNGTVDSNLSGPGGVTKGGTGTVTLSGTNTYAGTTTVVSGTLLVTASTPCPLDRA